MLRDLNGATKLDIAILRESRDAMRMKRLIATLTVIDPMLGVYILFAYLTQEIVWIFRERGIHEEKWMFIPFVDDFRGQ